MCDDIGYTLLTIFEHDDMNKIKALIKRKIGLKPNRIYARQCTCKQIESKVAVNFHNKFHISGSIPCSIHYGLFYNNELVQVVSLLKSRFSKRYDYECGRMTCHSEYSVIGGASKLFKNAFRNHNITSCITYADLRFGNGSTYRHCGFTRLEDTQPNYSYVKNGIAESRIKFQKHKLKKHFTNI